MDLCQVTFPIIYPEVIKKKGNRIEEQHKIQEIVYPKKKTPVTYHTKHTKQTKRDRVK